MIGHARTLTVAAVLAFAGQSAGAAPPMPPACGYDATRNELVSQDNPRSDQDVYPASPSPGFVAWSINVPHLRNVIQNCKTREFVVIDMPANNPAADDRFNVLVYGEGSYSLRQIGDEMVKMGATARRGRNEFGQFACNMFCGTESGL